MNLLGQTETVRLQGKVVDNYRAPIENVKIDIDKTGLREYTSQTGDFVLLVKPGYYELKFSHVGYFSLKMSVYVDLDGLDLGKIILEERIGNAVEVVHERDGIMTDHIPDVDLTTIPTAYGQVEDLVKVVGLGANTNNELTSNYSVRGGNYDENLIYVNGIQIYRPFLARSGQQEGLSFINPAFVKKINFSPGGFDAYYGDKLSSVLDITYKEPYKFGGSASASLMGGHAHVEGLFARKRGNYITGARYRANSYLLNSLPTKGDYNPTFFDYQLLANYYLDYSGPHRYTKLFVLGHYSNNNFRFAPSDRETSWGTVNEAYQLRVYYEGEEETKFQTFTAATGINWQKSKRFKMDFVGSVFHSIESEHFDVLGQYWINQLETDPSKEEFGDSTSNVGVGGFLDHARNDLTVWIGNVYANGKYDLPRIQNEAGNRVRFGEIYFGALGQYEIFEDVLSEWHLIDSAGYVVPNGDPNTIELSDVVKQTNIVESYRFTNYFQYNQNFGVRKDKVVRLKEKIKSDSTKTIRTKVDTIKGSPAIFSLALGNRIGYRSYNDEYWITPRFNFTYQPRSYFLRNDTIIRRDVKIKFASGLYYQPPFYRTMRGLLGEVNPEVVSQKSWHNVVGAEVDFDMWGRTFKFITEGYYKYMWDVVPYEIDNVRIRYYAENSATAYAYGIDAKVHGEFVKGVESFFRIGYLKTMEDIENDDYYIYLNSEGDTIYPGYTFNNVATDSLLQSPGYIPRPTDQRLTLAVFFQDQMPGFEKFKVSTSLYVGTPLPYGPPTYERYKDILRAKPYIRLDLGFMYDVIKEKERTYPLPKDYRPQKIKQLTFSLDAFNLLGINNVISYQWLQDVAGRYYAIPNHLTGRRINLKCVMKF